ncbi:hypothetical protein OHR68_13805 [Spirillospora sp. NBC_00431]
MPPAKRRRAAVAAAVATAAIIAAVIVDAVPAAATAAFVVGAALAGALEPGGNRGISWAGVSRWLRGSVVRRRKAAVPGGRLVRMAAALMEPRARRRWLEDVEVSLYDFAPEQHQALLRNFLAHAPAVIIVGWAAWMGKLPRVLAGIGRRPPGPR